MPASPPGPSTSGHRPAARRVVLIGLRASGKSTVASALAARRHLSSIDLDDRVRASFGGRTVSEIWARDGEPAFRTAEATCLAAALAEPPAILALGGGTPAIPAAAAMLAREAAAGRLDIVYLRTSVDRLVQRLTRARGDRPSLVATTVEQDPVRAEVVWATQQRDETYRRLATLVVEVDELLGGDPAAEPADAAETVTAFIDRTLAG